MNIWDRLRQQIEIHGKVCMVTISSTRGSAPRNAGARMLVTPSGIIGTIGGGALEWRAMAAAQALIRKGGVREKTCHALGPELGQCCGGHVELVTEVFTINDTQKIDEMEKQEVTSAMNVTIFGAGHVGKALVTALAPLDIDVRWHDERPLAFPSIVPGRVSLHDQDALLCLGSAPLPSLVFILTHSHALDLSLCDAALRHPHVLETCVIGSATKRARFEKRLAEMGHDAARINSLVCPIGIGDIRAKEPAAIAISVAAQILHMRDKHHAHVAVANERAS